MKYKLTENKIKMNDTTLYQIQAIKDFGNIEKGDFGGWIEAEENLSQFGNAWVYDDAMVYGDALVYGNARVYGDALVYGNARVSGNAGVYGNASVYGNARVSGNAKVAGDARVYGDAWVYGNARVYGNAIVYSNARVYGNARVSQNQYIQNCSCKDDLSKNIKESIRCQTGLGIFNEKIVAYKTVNKDMSSFQDKKFFYKVGEIAEVKNPEISNESCASGLHFSNMNYWDSKDGVFIQAEINLEDIITVQEGKIRCKKALITGMYER